MPQSVDVGQRPTATHQGIVTDEPMPQPADRAAPLRGLRVPQIDATPYALADLRSAVLPLNKLDLLTCIANDGRPRVAVPRPETPSVALADQTYRFGSNVCRNRPTVEPGRWIS